MLQSAGADTGPNLNEPLPVALASATVLLLALLLLFEAGLTALARRRGERDTALRRRLPTDPQRMRRAAGTLRTLLLVLLVAAGAGGIVAGSPLPALLAATGLALLYLLERAGRLRALGAHSPALGALVALLLRPLAALLPARQAVAAGRAADAADAAEAVEAIADQLAAAPEERQQMVQAVLALEQARVEDIMVPRNEVLGIDVGADWDEILDLVGRSPHTRLPLYEGELDRVIGVVHMKRLANELALGRLDRGRLREAATERAALFVPQGTTLQAQLIAFRQLRRRIAFVVDEYGDVLGLVTLEDILEEIVGEFTTQPAVLERELLRQPDGSWLVAGGAALRTVGRELGWELPTEGPRTLSGLIVEQLESIPAAGTRLTLAGREVEVLQVADNTVRTVRIRPASQ